MKNKWRMYVCTGKTDAGKQWVHGQLKEIGSNLKAAITVKEDGSFEFAFQCEETFENYCFSGKRPAVVCELNDRETIESQGRITAWMGDDEEERLNVIASKLGLRISLVDGDSDQSVYHFPIPLESFLWLCFEVNEIATRRLHKHVFVGEIDGFVDGSHGVTLSTERANPSLYAKEL